MEPVWWRFDFLRIISTDNPSHNLPVIVGCFVFFLLLDIIAFPDRRKFPMYTQHHDFTTEYSRTGSFHVFNFWFPNGHSTFVSMVLCFGLRESENVTVYTTHSIKQQSMVLFLGSAHYRSPFPDCVSFRRVTNVTFDFTSILVDIRGLINNQSTMDCAVAVRSRANTVRTGFYRLVFFIVLLQHALFNRRLLICLAVVASEPFLLCFDGKVATVFDATIRQCFGTLCYSICCLSVVPTVVRHYFLRLLICYGLVSMATTVVIVSRMCDEAELAKVMFGSAADWVAIIMFSISVVVVVRFSEREGVEQVNIALLAMSEICTFCITRVPNADETLVFLLSLISPNLFVCGLVVMAQERETPEDILQINEDSS
jgi:hypothetical protein